MHSAITGSNPIKTVSLLLIMDKSIVNEADLTGVTPLFLAVFTGNLDVVLLLLESGADPLKASKKASPLHICAERGFFEIAVALL